MAKKDDNKSIEMDITQMSPQKKLFVLREAIDLLALGIKVNQQVIDACYDDLTVYIQDYEWMQNEFNANLLNNSNVQNLPVDLETQAKNIYGESWDKLEDGLDQLNEKNGTYLRTYMYPQNDGNIRLKVFDEHDATLKRVYEDKYDLDINLDNDLRSNFTKPKITFCKDKLSKKKEDNKE